ncbi:unnamed protein product, partial [Amoebophrya sp. A120]
GPPATPHRTGRTLRRGNISTVRSASTEHVRETPPRLAPDPVIAAR